MWGIAHAQGIKLPTKDYWEFRDLITVHRAKGSKCFDGYLQLFHWTELIQRSRWRSSARSTRSSAGRTARTTSRPWSSASTR